MNHYEAERMAALRQAEYLRGAREARLAAGTRAGSVGLFVAGALRGMADWFDGGDARKRLGAARALD